MDMQEFLFLLEILITISNPNNLKKMRTLKLLFLVSIALMLSTNLTAAITIDCSQYKIAISSDGNAHDEDDIIAAPMAIAMIAEAGLKDRLVFHDYSNHIWGNDGQQSQRMDDAVIGAANRWNYPDLSLFYAVNKTAQLNSAKARFKSIGNALSASDRLYYACGGPMHVPWLMIQEVNNNKRQFILAVSHSEWNEKHKHSGSKTWNDIKTSGVKAVQIANQNKFDCGGCANDNDFNTKQFSKWHWLRDMGGKYNWLYNQNPFGGKFDPSDAGMVWWIFTGRPGMGNPDNPNNLRNNNNNNLYGSPAKCKDLFQNGPANPCGNQCTGNVAPTVSLTSPANGASFTTNDQITVSANASDTDGNVTSVQFFANGSSIGSDNSSPYSITTSLGAGTFDITAVATDNCNATTTSSARTITVTLVLKDDETVQNPTAGLNYAYYENNGSRWNVLPNFGNLNPVEESTVANFDISVRNRDLDWGIEYTGYVEVPTDGIYTFYTTSDDGSKLFIGSTEVVDNDGKHALKEESGTIGLQAGYHSITVPFFQGGGGQGLTVSYEGPGIAKTTIPNSALVYAGDVNPCDGNIAPATSISSPADGASFSTTDVVTISASASDTDGSITQVEFFAGATSLGVDNSAPYSISSSFAEGAYSLTTVATDNCGAATTSAPVGITVVFVDPCGTNTLPVVSVTAPADGASFVVGSNVALAASASDADGSISQVEFFVDGSSVGTDNSAPYTANYTMASGSHAITAVATDDCGATVTSASVTINETTDPQQPYGANLVPGTIEAEHFDLGGQGIAYNDDDATNKGSANFRTSEGVDIDLKSGITCVGWCSAGEWTEYTINVQQAGSYIISYSFSTNKNTNPKSFSFDLNGAPLATVNIAGNDPINNVGNAVFETRELGEFTLAAGTNLIRWTAGSNAICFDKIVFDYQTPADVTPPTVPTGLAIGTVTASTVDVSWNASTDTESGVAGYLVYADGSQVADVSATSTTISNLTCETSYTITVSAYDNAGNSSAQSAGEVALTSACAQGDYIFVNHVASGNRLGATTGAVDTRPITNTGANVQWEMETTDGAYFYLINVGTGQKLNAPTKQTINMVSAATTGNTAQWQWVDQGGGEYLLQSREWGKYFHINADGVSDISTKWNTNLAGVVWTFEVAPKSVETLTNVESVTLDLYPNPASTELNIEASGFESAQIKVFNTSGALVRQFILDNETMILPVEELNTGMYYMQISDANNAMVKQFIIE